MVEDLVVRALQRWNQGRLLLDPFTTSAATVG